MGDQQQVSASSGYKKGRKGTAWYDQNGKSGEECPFWRRVLDACRRPEQSFPWSSSILDRLP